MKIIELRNTLKKKAYFGWPVASVLSLTLSIVSAVFISVTFQKLITNPVSWLNGGLFKKLRDLFRVSSKWEIENFCRMKVHGVHGTKKSQVWAPYSYQSKVV